MLHTKLISSLAKAFPNEVQGGNFVKATALNNEPVSFQVVYRAGVIERQGIPIYVKVNTDLDISLITCYKVGYVPLLSTMLEEWDDHYSHTTAGLYPDPLFKRITDSTMEIDEYRNNRRFEVGEKHRLIATSDCYQTLWFTVNEACKTLPAGEHNVQITFYNSLNGEVLSEEKFVLHVIDARLPAQQMKRVCRLCCDCLAEVYKVEIFGDRFFEMMRSFVTEAKRNGMNEISLPAFTPIWDKRTERDGMTVQLVGVEVKNDKYLFDFSRMKRYIDLCRECGIFHFEHTPLATKWGGKCVPKIMATVNGAYKRIFDQETNFYDEEYKGFLEAYVDALAKFRKEMNIEEENMSFYVTETSIEEDKCLIAYSSAKIRMIGIRMYVAGIKGVLKQDYNCYYSVINCGLVHPFLDPGDGSGYMVYPGYDGTAVPSIRGKVMNEGLLDYRALQTLEGYIGRDAVLAFLKENLGEIHAHTYYDGYKLLKVRDMINTKISECVKCRCKVSVE